MNSPGYCFVFLCLAFNTAFASTQASPNVQTDRVAARPDLRATTALRGHVPAWAVSANDRGAAPDSQLRITFLLSRSPEMQASFTELLREQQDPSSPRYHQWLTPQQVGEQYGPTQHDLDALTSWLGSQGLKVVGASPSRVFVDVAASASTVANALATSFHTFSVNGKSRVAATADPSIPTAFASIVNSISGLTEEDIHPMSRGQGMVKPEQVSGDGVRPHFTNGQSNYITPGDFAVIFDMKPVYSSGYTGAGQKVAVIGRSRVAATDIAAFESSTGLANNLPNIVIPTAGADPGTTNDGDQQEATLDVERLIGTAPAIQADLVVNSIAGGGLFTAASYEVETLRDPVMTISFGACEGYEGASAVSQWDGLFSVAASEGISVFVSAGDSGAAGCDEQFEAAPAYQFPSINYICSSSYATCIGGTEFAEGFNTRLYWSSSNGAGFTNALSYIPEGAWNEPNGTGTSSSSYVVSAGGGGASIYVPKPVWQTGTGVPADSARDVPDMSFPASFHDAYYGCFAAGGGDCNANQFYFFFGTSAGTPTMAAVTALLNQKTGGSQGNLNPLLYRLAASSSGVFHDETPASVAVNPNNVNCSSPNPSICNNATPSATSPSGGQAGFSLTTGYDQATGLGSLDVANFLTAAAAAAKPNFAPTTLEIHGDATTISNTQTTTLTATLTSSTQGTPTGTVQFYANGTALGTATPIASGVVTMPSVPFPAAGVYFISATYSGDSVYATSTAPGYQLTVTGLASTTTLTVSSAAFPVGTTVTFTAKVTSNSESVVPTGLMRFIAPGSPVGDFAAVVALSGGSATSPPIRFPNVGNYSMTAIYAGDSVYSPSTSAAISFAVQKLATRTQLASTVGSIGTGGSKSFTAEIEGVTSGSTAPAPTGSVQLYANGVALGARFPVGTPNSLAFSPPELFSTAGTYAITAVYSGDADWQPSTADGNIYGLTLTVLPTPASYQLSAVSPTLSIKAGVTSGNTDQINVLGQLGFAGTVNLTCLVAFNGTAPVTSAPTCALVNNSLSVQLDSAGPSTTLSINSVAPRDIKGPRVIARSNSQPLGRDSHREIAFCALLLCFIPLRRRSWRALAILIGFAACFNALSGCSGGSSNSTPPPPAGTTAGNYTVTITASSPGSGAPAPPPVTIALTVN
jgi:subtilase family serine protease